ncbi:MAG: HD domain-containing protein [Actinobacteria bacterium]|nr:HD domain-containing protein [Actinomycetota bacterium]
MIDITRRFRDVRISTKIVVPYLLLLLVMVVGVAPLISSWVGGKIQSEARTRLWDARRAIDSSLTTWEDQTRSSVEWLATGELAESTAFRQTPPLAGAVRTTLERLARKHGLDFVAVTMPNGEVVSVGPAMVPSPATSGPLGMSCDLVNTSSGWGFVHTARPAESEQPALLKIEGGGLLNAALFAKIGQATGGTLGVAFAANGRVIGTSGVAEPAACNDCHSQRGLAPIDTASSRVLVRQVDMAGHGYLTLHAPVRLNDQVAGTYVILLPLDSVEAAMGSARALVYGGGAFLFLAITVLGTGISRSISRPIVRLSEASQDIAAGNLSREIEVGSNDEVGRLSSSVATMTRSLSTQLSELGLLHQVSLTVNSSLDLDYVLETLLESAIRVLGADGGSIMLLDRSGTHLQVAVTQGYAVHGLESEKSGLDDGPAGWVVRHRQPLLLPDDPYDRDESLVAKTEISSAVSVPIESHEGVIGVLNLNLFDSERRFDRHTVTFVRTLANHTGTAIEKARHYKEINRLYADLVRALAGTIDAKDPYTYGHSEMVARYSRLVGARMGMDETELKGLETAAYLHDIGKIGVRDAVLTKPTSLTPSERAIVETHPVVGAEILEKIVFPWPVIETVRHHHERWDGRGYPHNLSGDSIPLHARILSVADSFDAMTSDRPYRPGREMDDAVNEVLRCAGSQFDPQVVSVFLEAVDAVRREFDTATHRVNAGMTATVLKFSRS